MTAAEVTSGLTQAQYTQLLNGLARAVRMQRKYITIVSAERINELTTRFRIKLQGAYTHLLVDEIKLSTPVYISMGLII